MTHSPDVRALAARGMARVVEGQSLRGVYAAAAAELPDPRDRALLSALLHDGARWWLRFAAARDALLQRPLPARDADIAALLVLGLVQLEIQQLPAYASVDASVNAARALRKPKLAGLVNAVLRRWQREREQRLQSLDANEQTRWAMPYWLIDRLRKQWPRDYPAILQAGNTQAPLWLRANRRRGSRVALATRLRDAGIACETPADSPDAVRLLESRPVETLPGYAQGDFSVQDGAAQQAAALLAVADGMRVLDACAAPGGKTAHILEHADVGLLALDSDARRLVRLRENLQRLGLHADAIAGDAAAPETWWNGQPFERILIDAPCSASGIIRRQPDIKLHRRESDLDGLTEVQSRLLEALWPLLRPGGRLVYATCSVLADENQVRIGAFLERHTDATAVTSLPGWRQCGPSVQNLPGEKGMDGFFYAVVDKSG